MNNDALYWGQELNRLQVNPPKTSENYYNEDFNTRMKKAREDIDSLVDQKDKAWGATQQAQDDYETFKGSMTSYNDAYRNAKAEFGIKQAGENYEKSKKALAMAEMTLNALPSQINAQSNVVLTQSQREKAYNIMSDKLTANMTNMSKSAQNYEEAWKNLREKATSNVASVMSSQRAKMLAYNNAWMMAMGEYEQKEREWSNATIEYERIGAQYRRWQAQQHQQSLDVYLKKLNTALSRYITAMDTQNSIVSDKLDKLRGYAYGTTDDVNVSGASILVSGIKSKYMSRDDTFSLLNSIKN